ncbi:MAG TPA: glycosyltransferase family 87 protein [Gemmatales bacterium]|nr:glycosyltransferase family 87 protein [Gemmatales bacterium]
MLRWPPSPRQLELTALMIWSIFLIVIAVLVSRPGKQGRIFPTYVDAGRHFRLGEPLYSTGPIADDRDLYRYSPIASVLFIPWDFISLPLSSVLWRWGQIIAFLWALKAWSRITIPNVPWPALFLLALPICGGNVNNAQINPLVAALLLGSLVAFHGRHYWLAAFAIGIATAFKGYPLSLGLLLCLIDFRRFTLPLVVAHLAVACLPFAIQDHQYVVQQFREWVHLVTLDDRSQYTLDTGYFDFQRVLLRWGVTISQMQYRIIEVAVGLVAAGFLCWGMWKQQWSRSKAIYVAGGLGFLWMTLFGPTTESATYILIAGFICHAVIVVGHRSLWERILVWTAYALMISNVVINWFPQSIANDLRTLMPQPHAAMLLLIWVLMDSLRTGDSEVTPGDVK